MAKDHDIQSAVNEQHRDESGYPSLDGLEAIVREREELDAASALRCAICGLRVEDEPTVPIKGVWGEGIRHADNAICMNVLRDADGDVND